MVIRHLSKQGLCQSLPRDHIGAQIRAQALFGDNCCPNTFFFMDQRLKLGYLIVTRSSTFSLG